MRKFNYLNRLIAIMGIVAMSLIIFTGCGSANNQNTSKSNTDATTSTKKTFNTDEMKKKQQDEIKALVSDGTINQTQGDKILEVLTSNTQKFDGQKKTQDNQSKDTKKTTTEDKTQNKQRVNPLSQLVTDGIITQAQADTVMTKTRGNFNKPQDTTATN